MPIQKKAIHDYPCSIFSKSVELGCPFPSAFVADGDVLLLIKMVMAAMVAGNNTSGFNLPQEGRKARPVYGSCGTVPIMDLMYWVNRYVTLRL